MTISSTILSHGGFELIDCGVWRPIEGQTATREWSEGYAYEFRLVAGRTVDLTIGEVHWDNGDRDVRVVSVEKAPDSLRRLERGLRLGIQKVSSKRAFAEIRVAHVKDADWSNMYQTTEDEMSGIVGERLHKFLGRFGRVAVGTRGDVLGDASRRRNDLGVVFDDDASLVPAVTYFATRVLPISMHFQG